MEIQYSPFLVTLSVLVAIFASYVALNLANSVTHAVGRARMIWLVCGAIAMGVGIWSMHFVGMLAFEMPGMAMAYDIPLMVLSIVVAIIASALALYVSSQPTVPMGSVISGGIAMAAAIAGMHYIGMYSMRMAASIEWNVYLVVLSVLIALGASFAALSISIRFRNQSHRVWRLLLASTFMGIAISGMHYTGMVAATFVHDDGMTIKKSNLLVTSGLTTIVVVTTLLILGLALATSIGQRILARRERSNKEKLKSSEDRFRLLVDAVKDYAIFMLDPKGRITTWNSGAERIHGYSSDDILGRPVSIFYNLNANKNHDFEKHLSEARARGHFETESLLIRKEGATFWANVVIAPLFNSQGELTGFSMVTRDITRDKETEAHMRKLNEELEKRVEDRTAELKNALDAAEVANNTKSAFLANMSHEIRTPLGAVLGFSELLLNDEMTVSERANSIEVIKRNGRLLSNIINDILDLSKVEAGKLTVEKVEVPFFEVMTEIGSVLNLEATEKGIKLTVTSEGAIPNTIKTDPLRLRQILLNIVGNAIKFTKRGSVDVKVQLLPASSGTSMKLAFIVKDTGEGIAPEQIPRLFSPFTQADVSTTRRFGGTGLGLALSKKLANALGGDVVLSASTPEVGSTFIITIDPGHVQEVLFDSVAAAGPSKVTRLPTARRTLGNMRILVVDDSHDNQDLLKKLLRVAGATVEIANNGKEGVTRGLGEAFDLILMDLQMPEMDGYQATRVLRERGFRRPIIALTAHAMKEERRRCLENGFDDHLTKPIDRESLLETLAEYAAQKPSLEA